MSLKYKKGTFVTVPNRDQLRGLDGYSQVLFMWLCSYADVDGKCFPSISTLKNDCGMSRDTVIRRLELLEERGLLQKTKSKKKGSKENAVNQYQIMILADDSEVEGGSRSQRPRSSSQRLGGSSRERLELKPSSLTKTKEPVAGKTATVSEEVFSSEKEVQKLITQTSRKDLRIIGLFFEWKQYEFENKPQFNLALKRNLRPAKDLIGYTKRDLETVFAKADKASKERNFEWTLETVAKMIPNIINRKYAR